MTAGAQYPMPSADHGGASLSDRSWSAGIRGQHADRAEQLADALRSRIQYAGEPPAPAVRLDGGEPEAVTADLVQRAHRRSHQGMTGESTPTDRELQQAAAILHSRAVAAAKAAAEHRAVAEAARQAGEVADGAAQEAARAARRDALRAQLAELDQPSP